nr:UPF0158 family protein [uncultured Psychroserpens sp.]
MANSKSVIIKEIAQELDSGFDCYYNLKNNEIVPIPNFSKFPNEEEFQEIFESDLQKVSAQKENFVKIEVLESFESFKIMERFINKVTNIDFKTNLEDILQKKKPFMNFKFTVESSKYRKLWFDFKRQELEKIVKKKLEILEFDQEKQIRLDE